MNYRYRVLQFVLLRQILVLLSAVPILRKWGSVRHENKNRCEYYSLKLGNKMILVLTYVSIVSIRNTRLYLVYNSDRLPYEIPVRNARQRWTNEPNGTGSSMTQR